MTRCVWTQGFVLLAALMCALGGCSAARPVGMTQVTSADGTYEVAYQTIPSPIPLNQPFAIEFQVRETASGAVPQNIAVHVDGRMPHHRHGMMRVPVIESTGDGEYLVKGMLFHMPGDWELHFDVTKSGVVERAQVDVEIE